MEMWMHFCTDPTVPIYSVFCYDTKVIAYKIHTHTSQGIRKNTYCQE